MTRFKITCRCQQCHHKYHFFRQSETDFADDVPDKPCPKCSKEQVPRGLDVAAGKAPAIGGSNIVKAMDMAGEIVMQDYGLTNLKSDGREGATMAPPLPPQQQARADSFWGGGGPRKRRGLPSQQMAQMPFNPQVARAAVASGAYVDPRAVNPVEQIHRARHRPPIQIIAGDGT